MRVFVAGATGFIGRALVPVLQREGHSLVVWARSAARARSRLGADVEVVDAGADLGALSTVLERCDAVVNLAGEPIMGGRWTTARRRVLYESRVGVANRLVQALAAASRRPRVLVSGSAVGYYGDRGDEILREDSSAGGGFLAQLCQDWEAAARVGETFGLRIVLLRTGIVLGRDGGALAQMLPPFRVGLGGPIGSGRPYLPWVHLHDLVAIIARALVDARFQGPINGVAPDRATSRQFARALGRALRRPALLPMPALALRAIFGEAATVLLGSQRVDSAALRRLGFSFAFPALDEALADILAGPPIPVHRLRGSIDTDGGDASRKYLAGRRPIYELRTTTMVKAPLEETFAFFSKAENLGLLTPAAMRFSMTGPAPDVGEDTTIEYQLRVGPVPISWRSRIVSWMPGSRFIDLQEKGPYRSWWHEHSFRAAGSSTAMEDRVRYAPPLGLLGRIANRLFIVPALRRIFLYRADVIRLRFGTT
jgi:uncharacterized protein (TIGR01777 family)